ncbi:MAG: Eco57I restriction-modification methylase domain-containing protein [Nitrospiraceae bacterium]|nr:Eco57I restriction-modification methylase domain-containing protein [Nitrospiraceae bacterium]
MRNNIFGVDIDPQAVEITMMSLYLKALEGERGLLPRKQHLLPSLSSNVKCGNSLIGYDILEQGQLYEGTVPELRAEGRRFGTVPVAGLSDEDKSRINPFDWNSKTAGFGEIMENGGFDCVIGNPPYVFTRDKGFTELEKNYFKKFKHSNYQLNTFTLFTEQGFNLLKRSGYLGYIIPNNWLTISTMKPFRDFIIGSTGELIITNNLFKVFQDANVDTSIIIFKKAKPTYVYLTESTEPSKIDIIAKAKPSDVLSEPIIQYRLYKNQEAKNLLKKIETNFMELGEITLVKAGLKAYETGKGKPKQTDAMKRDRIYHSRKKLNSSYRIYLDGQDVRRYATTWSGEYLKYGQNLAAPRDSQLFEGERILVRQIPSRPPYSINATIVFGEELNDINSMVVKKTSAYSLKYILGIINSKLLTIWFDFKFEKFQRAIFPQFKVNELATFPIRTI